MGARAHARVLARYRGGAAEESGWESRFLARLTPAGHHGTVQPCRIAAAPSPWASRMGNAPPAGQRRWGVRVRPRPRRPPYDARSLPPALSYFAYGCATCRSMHFASKAIVPMGKRSRLVLQPSPARRDPGHVRAAPASRATCPSGRATGPPGLEAEALPARAMVRIVSTSSLLARAHAGARNDESRHRCSPGAVHRGGPHRGRRSGRKASGRDSQGANIKRAPRGRQGGRGNKRARRSSDRRAAPHRRFGAGGRPPSPAPATRELQPQALAGASVTTKLHCLLPRSTESFSSTCAGRPVPRSNMPFM